MHLRWPTKIYLVDHAHRFIYCPIPKAACSSLLQWCLAVSGEHTAASGKRVHPYVRQHRSLRAAGWRVARAALRDPGYFKFTFVRHPFPRLVSAYANKFLKVERLAWPAIRAIQARQDGIDAGIVQRSLQRWSVARRRDLTDAEAQRSVTFRQFVEHVASNRPSSLEAHWRPQHFFLGCHSFDFIGRIERLQADFALVQATLGLNAPLPKLNRSPYAGTCDGEIVADWEASRLRMLPELPAWQRYYTPDLKRLAARVYAADFERFGYDIHWTGTQDMSAFDDCRPAGSSRHAA